MLRPASLTIATRESALALWQAHHVRDRLTALYPGMEVRILGMTTEGDRRLSTSLAKIGGKGLFVKELESALEIGSADLAVHSMKDVPMDVPAGFTIAAILEREDARDAFVSNAHAALSELPAGACVGTSSLRRESQIRAQLRFTDGAMVSLQPRTQFRIDAYEFKGEADGSEKGFFSLLKGAMRTITGAIGKADRKAYRLDTAVATIGIRGTEYAVAYGNSITVTTNSGLIEVCNSAGCLLVEAGQSAYVPDANTLPVFTTRNALDPLSQPPAPTTPGFSSGDNPDISPPPHQRLQGPFGPSP